MSGCDKEIRIVVHSDGTYSFAEDCENAFRRIFPNAEITIDEDGSVRIKNIYDPTITGADVFATIAPEISGGFIYNDNYETRIYLDDNDSVNSSLRAYIVGSGIVSYAAEAEQKSSWVLSDGQLWKIAESDLTLQDIAGILSEDERDAVHYVRYDFSIAKEDVGTISAGAEHFKNLKEVIVRKFGIDDLDDSEGYSSMMASPVPVSLRFEDRLQIVIRDGKAGTKIRSVLPDNEKNLLRDILSSRESLGIRTLIIDPAQASGYTCLLVPIAMMIRELDLDISDMDMELPIGRYKASTGEMTIDKGPVGWSWGLCGDRMDDGVPDPVSVGSFIGILSHVTGGMSIAVSNDTDGSREITDRCRYREKWLPYALLTGTNITTSGDGTAGSCPGSMQIDYFRKDGNLYHRIYNPAHYVFDSIIGASVLVVTEDDNGTSYEYNVLPVSTGKETIAVPFSFPSGHMVEESPLYNTSAAPHRIHQNAAIVECYQMVNDGNNDFAHINNFTVEAFAKVNTKRLIVTSVVECLDCAYQLPKSLNTYDFTHGYTRCDMTVTAPQESMIVWAKYIDNVYSYFTYKSGTLEISEVRDYCTVSNILGERLATLRLPNKKSYESGKLPNNVHIVIPDIPPETAFNLAWNVLDMGVDIEVESGKDVVEEFIEAAKDFALHALLDYSFDGEKYHVSVGTGSAPNLPDLKRPIMPISERSPLVIIARLIEEILNTLSGAGFCTSSNYRLWDALNLYSNDVGSLFDGETVSGHIFTPGGAGCTKVKEDSGEKKIVTISVGGVGFITHGDVSSFDNLEEIGRTVCDECGSKEYHIGILEFRADLYEGKVWVGNLASEEIIKGGVGYIDDDCAYYTPGEEGNPYVPPVDPRVEYTITKNSDGSVLVAYKAFDSDGKDITDEFKTISVGDRFYYIGDEQ